MVIFPKEFITFDEDLVENSAPPPDETQGEHRAIETLVKVGYTLGKWNDLGQC